MAVRVVEGARGCAQALAGAGFVPVPVETDELTEAGGVTCLTREIRAGIMPTAPGTGSPNTSTTTRVRTTAPRATGLA